MYFFLTIVKHVLKKLDAHMISLWIHYAVLQFLILDCKILRIVNNEYKCDNAIMVYKMRTYLLISHIYILLLLAF